MYQVEGTVPALIVDPGSHTIKAGTYGEDLPSVLLPSRLASELPASDETETSKQPSIRAGTYALSKRRDNVDIVSPFSPDGLVEHWDLFEDLLSHTLRTELQVDIREHALLLAEPNHNGRKARERIVDLIFEKFQVPALYMAHSAVLSAYANGKTTGIVLDVGHSGTSAVPVEDGSVIKGVSIRTAVGGRAMNSVLGGLLEKKQVKLRPVWSFKRRIVGKKGLDEEMILRDSEIEELNFPGTTHSFGLFAKERLLEDVKANICVVHENPGIDLSSLPIVSDSYELPDGNTLELGEERFSVAEQTIFSHLPHITTESNSDARLSYVNQYVNGSQHTANASMQRMSAGLHGLVVDAIRACHEGVHRDMYAGVCLTGGVSDTGGLFERLSFGLQETYHKVRVLAATGSRERKYCAWTGGSILSTFREFQKMWFSRSEYEENGSSFVHRKCQ